MQVCGPLCMSCTYCIMALLTNSSALIMSSLSLVRVPIDYFGKKTRDEENHKLAETTINFSIKYL